MEAFEHWYLDEGNFDRVVILSPKYLNERFLSEKIIRYARRINKYGESINFNVERHVREKPAEKEENADKTPVNPAADNNNNKDN